MKTKVFLTVCGGFAALVVVFYFLIFPIDSPGADKLISEAWYVSYVVIDPPVAYIFSENDMHYVRLEVLGITYGVDPTSRNPDVPKLVHTIADNKWQLLFKDQEQARKFISR